jgi:hypothetical protein
MTRWIAVLGCALTLALTITPFGNEAEARYTRKKCIAPTSVTWVCRANERCCYDWLLRKGTCPTTRCF